MLTITFAVVAQVVDSAAHRAEGQNEQIKDIPSSTNAARLSIGTITNSQGIVARREVGACAGEEGGSLYMKNNGP
jgi:hypothetical protein